MEPRFSFEEIKQAFLLWETAVKEKPDDYGNDPNWTLEQLAEEKAKHLVSLIK